MNKQQFLNELRSGLKTLPEEERQDIQMDYEEHFEFGLEEGKAEEEISQSLGSPKQLARELLATHHLDKAKSKTNTGNVFRANWAVIGLSFFNLVIVLGPLAAVAGVVIGLWGVSLGFTLTPLLVLFDLVRYPEAFQSFGLFASLALCGIGILLGLVLFSITKVLVKGLVKYLNFNVMLVKGGLKA